MYLNNNYFTGWTPIMGAAARGNTDVVQVLLQHPEVNLDIQVNSSKLYILFI